MRIDSVLRYNITHDGACVDDFFFVREGKVIRSRTFHYEGKTYIEERDSKRVLSFKREEKV